MPEYRFNDQQVEAILTETEGQVKKFDADLTKFEEMKHALRALWEGDESDLYSAVFADFQNGAVDVRNMVSEVHNALADAQESNSQMRRHMRLAIDA